MGQSLVNELWPNAEELTAAIEDASEHVRSMVRIHCRDGSAELGDTTTDRIVMSATFAALRETAAAMPGLAHDLPPNWETTPHRKALDKIEAGKLQITQEADPDIADGSAWSDADSFPQLSSRDELAGL